MRIVEFSILPNAPASVSSMTASTLPMTQTPGTIGWSARSWAALWFAAVFLAAGSMSLAAVPRASHCMIPKRRPTKARGVSVPAADDVETSRAVSLDLSRDLAELDALIGDCDTPTLREHDEIWRIDSSGTDCTWDDQAATDGLDYCRLEGRSDWRRSTVDRYDEAGRERKATVLVLHGNRTTLAEATGMVWDVYRHVSQAEERPLRMVLWTWPSGRTFNRPRRDVRLKVDRSELAGRQLAGVLERIDPRTPVGLVGFSFGARAIAEALHIRGQRASQEADRALDVSRQQGRPAPIRALLIAAAMDDDSLLPGGPHELAASQVDRMIVTHNGCDRLLRTYRHLYCWHGPNALGVTGLVPDVSSNGGGFENVESLDVAASVGKIHRWPNYIQAPEIIAALRDDLLGP